MSDKIDAIIEKALATPFKRCDYTECPHDSYCEREVRAVAEAAYEQGTVDAAIKSCDSNIELGRREFAKELLDTYGAGGIEQLYIALREQAGA